MPPPRSLSAGYFRCAKMTWNPYDDPLRGTIGLRLNDLFRSVPFGVRLLFHSGIRDDGPGYPAGTGPSVSVFEFVDAWFLFGSARTRRSETKSRRKTHDGIRNPKESPRTCCDIAPVKAPLPLTVARRPGIGPSLKPRPVDASQAAAGPRESPRPSLTFLKPGADCEG